MPLVDGGIVIDANGRAKAHAAVGAARDHHIGASAVASGSDARQHVDVVISGAAGAVDCQKDLTC